MVAAMIRVAASGLGLIFAASGVQKLAGGRSSVQVRDRLGLPRGMWRCVGLAELAGAAGVAAGSRLPGLGRAAGAGLTALMLGAIGCHVRAGDRAAAWAPAALLGVTAAGVAVGSHR